MPLAVVCFCGYLHNELVQWRDDDWVSYKWVQALKGRSLKGYASVPVRGVRKRLSNDNLADAVEWFGVFAGDYLREQRIKGPFLVVPLPNSDCVSTSTKKPRTRKLAKSVCDALGDGSAVVDCLRWKENLGSASKGGGTRRASILYRNLVTLDDALKDLDDDLRVLLVDDVTTSGGHLQACAAKLDSKGLSVDIVMCGGKTVSDQNNAAFHIYEYNLDEYEP